MWRSAHEKMSASLASREVQWKPPGDITTHLSGWLRYEMVTAPSAAEDTQKVTIWPRSCMLGVHPKKIKLMSTHRSVQDSSSSFLCNGHDGSDPMSSSGGRLSTVVRPLQWDWLDPADLSAAPPAAVSASLPHCTWEFPPLGWSHGLLAHLQSFCPLLSSCGVGWVRGCRLPLWASGLAPAEWWAGLADVSWGAL